MLTMLCLGTTGCLSVKVFHQLAIEPNDQFYEFGQSEDLYEGSYLGTEIRQGRRMHHYCFGGQQHPGVLEGTGRWLHMYIDADGYGQALAFENDACGLPEVAPACLVFGVHPPHYYPKERVHRHPYRTRAVFRSDTGGTIVPWRIHPSCRTVWLLPRIKTDTLPATDRPGPLPDPLRAPEGHIRTGRRQNL